jgi:hypothetical protein
MNKLKRAIVVLGLIGLLVAACIPSKQQINEILTAAEQITFVPVTYTPDVNVIVAQTFAAMTAQAGGQPVPPTATTNAPGSISGTLSYPSEGIPPLRVVAYNLFDQSYRYVDTQQDQNTYQITSLAPGKYHVVAYVAGGGLAGGYTPAVACGLMVTCTDHALLEVMVFSGQDTPNINPRGPSRPCPRWVPSCPRPRRTGLRAYPGTAASAVRLDIPRAGFLPWQLSPSRLVI